MKNFKRTTNISSNIGRGCEHCGYPIGALGDGDIADSINHYIEAHGYELVHVGTQSDRDNDGDLWHHSVAVLGHENPPALAPPVAIIVGPEIPRPPAQSEGR